MLIKKNLINNTVIIAIIMFLIISFMFLNTSILSYAANELNIVLDNNKVSFTDAQPFIDGNSCTMVPISSLKTLKPF